ncbi:MAG: metallophosphoesterase, partial [Lentisphaeria bacterium]
KFNSGFVAGLYHVNDMLLYVNRGTAIWNGFPIRLGIPSEITIAELVNY